MCMGALRSKAQAAVPASLRKARLGLVTAFADRWVIREPSLLAGSPLMVPFQSEW